MQASVGDHITVHGLRVGDAERHGEVIEVNGPDGSPPYLVRWENDGHTALFIPGAGAEIVPAARD